ncbi:MAG: hypothetical protein ABUK01_10380 [Leptospirales bacterium]
MKPQFQYIAIVFFFHIVLFNGCIQHIEKENSLIKDKDSTQAERMIRTFFKAAKSQNCEMLFASTHPVLREQFEKRNPCEKLFELFSKMKIIKIERDKKNDGERPGIAFKVFVEIDGEPEVNTVWVKKYNDTWGVTDF